MKIKNWFKAGIASIGVLLLAACGANNATTTPSNPNAFTYAINGNPSATNPVVVSDRWGLTMVNMIYSPLVRAEDDGTQKFELAESIDVSDDGLVMTVKLKQNVKWSDGEDFTADDVVFTYNQKANKDNGSFSKMWIGDEQIQVEKVDDYTVRFILPTVSAAAIANVPTDVYIMPEHAYNQITDFSANELDVTPVGTGPYKLVEYRRGEYIQFEANENYYGGKAAINTVVLRIITSNDTAKLALQTGEADAAVVLPSDIKDLNADAISTYAYSENRVGYMGLNTATTELSDVRVRQAILYALNKDDMNKAAYLNEEYYTTPYSVLPPNNAFVTQDVEKYTQNLDRAKELLSQAGVSNLTLRLGYTASDPAQTLQATLIQQQLQQIGVTVELTGADNSALFTELRKAGSTAYHLFLGGYIMGNDPDSYRALFETGRRSNYFQYSSATVDGLFAAGAAELNGAARHEIYNDLQRTIAQDAIIYPIVDNKRILAVNKRITGVEDAKLISIYSLEDMSKLRVK